MEVNLDLELVKKLKIIADSRQKTLDELINNAIKNLIFGYEWAHQVINDLAKEVK